jgi:hypothetical protein
MMYVRHRNTGTVLVTIYNCGHWHFIAVIPGTRYYRFMYRSDMVAGGGYTTCTW